VADRPQADPLSFPVARWQEDAASGDVEAMFDLGMYLVHVDGDWRQGQTWLERASSTGHEEAGFALSDLYGELDDEPWQRTEQALETVAAGKKSPEALFRLAEHYLINKDQPEKSEPIMRQTAEAGHVHAMSFMATFFCRPRGDVEGQRRWTARAAARGSWLASFRLAEFAFADGDLDRGRHHLKQALDRNFPHALCTLADGDEFSADQQEDLIRVAAFAGDGMSQARLCIRLRGAGRVAEADALSQQFKELDQAQSNVKATTTAKAPWWRTGRAAPP